MIRKGTWAVLIVFIAVLGLAYYLQKSPLKTPASADITPSPTAEVPLLEGWQAQDIQMVEVKSPDRNLEVNKNPDGTWVIASENVPAKDGAVGLITAQLTSMRILSQMDASYPLDSLGLSSPEKIIVFANAQGKQVEVQIGNATPTDSGYYVRLDQGTPVVVSKDTVDAVMNMMQKDQLVEPTPTPGGTAFPDATITP